MPFLGGVSKFLPNHQPLSKIYLIMTSAMLQGLMGLAKQLFDILDPL
jgi:hypothetical protein